MSIAELYRELIEEYTPAPGGDSVHVLIGGDDQITVTQAANIIKTSIKMLDALWVTADYLHRLLPPEKRDKEAEALLYCLRKIEAEALGAVDRERPPSVFEMSKALMVAASAALEVFETSPLANCETADLLRATLKQAQEMGL